MVERYRPKRYYLYVISFPNGKRYYGITSEAKPKARFVGHLKLARNGGRGPLSCALRKFGGGSFRTLVVGGKEYIKELEVLAIAKFRTTNRQFGYNVAIGGDISPMETKAARRRLSKYMKDRCASDPQFVANLIARLGPNTPERKAKRVATYLANLDPESIRVAARKRSKSMKGRKQSPEHIQNRTQSRVANGKRWNEASRLKAGVSQRRRFAKLRAEEVA